MNGYTGKIFSTFCKGSTFFTDRKLLVYNLKPFIFFFFFFFVKQSICQSEHFFFFFFFFFFFGRVIPPAPKVRKETYIAMSRVIFHGGVSVHLNYMSRIEQKMC